MSDSDSESDWEEVEVPEEGKHLEITIATHPAKKKRTNSERAFRVNSHKLHTLALLANAWIRNKWINDPLLHARLLSLTPLSLQTAFSMIHKSRVPEQHMRGRMFETAMGRLAFWWAQTFFDVTLAGHICTRSYDVVHDTMQTLDLPQDEEWDVELLQEVLGDEGELIRTPNSLMKHALMQKGSRDTSAQLFTALCRGLGIPARLVVSLQGVPFQNLRPKPAKGDDKGEEPSKGKGKGKGKAKADASLFRGNGQRLDGGSVPPKSGKAKGKEKAKPAVKLRKSKSKGTVLGSASTSQIDPITTPPVFWAEVFSRPDGRWFPVDPIRGTVNQAASFDPAVAYALPTPSTATAHPDSAYARVSAGPAPVGHAKAPKRVLHDNRMTYVLAFEEDGYGRDVTRRYSKQFTANLTKVRGGKTHQAWWELVVDVIRRPYRLHRDDVEDTELDTAQLLEGMPTTMDGFKDHPSYVLLRHLTQIQTIHPPPPQTRELGKFRGESVYPRSAVVSLKTAENWMRSAGRQVKEGEQPMKLIKMRASTIGRMRELEAMREGLRIAGEQADADAAANGGDDPDASGEKGKGREWETEAMQGLYALSQTEPYLPDPVVNVGSRTILNVPWLIAASQGKIPKNRFGNIDMYVPSMLPAGAVHVPCKSVKGTAKIARKLGFDHAEAVTGFEFKNRRAAPILKGIVIAAENESALLEAYWEVENDAAEKARAKRRERVLKRWTRLVYGLRIRKSLQEEYKDRQPATVGEQGERLKDVEILPGLAGGGFVNGADAVVEAYHLPNPFLPANSAGPSGTTSDNEAALEVVTYDLETMDVDPDPGPDDVVQPEPPRKAPKTLQQLAEETTARLKKEFERDDIGENEEEELSPPPPTASAPKAPKVKPSRAPSERNPTKTKVGGTAARRTSARKRLRNGGTDSEPEDEPESSPAKRPKAGIDVAPPVAASARSLRPRRTKTQTELQIEQERERAFQRAVAG
ncbi:hypothetical protein B0H15DRAFT_954498 [Mycena belliarum]|uniref:Rad4-domain-containing protein n=1 Tax=Mycena belliarum TaxID=1033014 RepID=A0AAD6TYC1_9AGAR|nr:hypothetical protein B0H15DRAFT_954498 [Mycena belliae]